MFDFEKLNNFYPTGRVIVFTHGVLMGIRAGGGGGGGGGVVRAVSQKLKDVES